MHRAVRGPSENLPTIDAREGGLLLVFRNGLNGFKRLWGLCNLVEGIMSQGKNAVDRCNGVA